MKKCLKCGQSYTDNTLNFCLNDGELLVDTTGYEPPPTRYADDSPPTLLMNQPRVTNPIDWAGSSPPATWQQQTPVQNPQQMFGPHNAFQSPSQTLAVISLGLGVGSVTIGWCCSLGLLLGPAALITGFIALSQNKKDPDRYGGRGLAIGGIVTGSIFLVGYALLIVLYGAAILFGGMN
jgi:hypothetical protein